jgi:hypothetical protein
MASTLEPLCPACFTRVLAWSASSCPSCKVAASLAPCDRCRKSRAGSFVPASGFKELEGPQEPFLCRDCMEETLEDVVDARCTEAIWAVAIVMFSVFWWKWMPAWGTMAAFALTLAAFTRWMLAVRRQKRPGRRREDALRFFAQQIVKARNSRAKALK